MFCPTAHQNIDTATYANVTGTEAEYLRSSDLMSSTSYLPIDSFSVGDSYYKFIHPVIVNHEPSAQGWRCYINELTNYVGFGDTEEAALKELKINIHAGFQQLSKKRPFEMSEQDQTKWRELVNVVDLLDYKITTPVVVREIGCVSYQKISHPARIKWLSGKNYFIDPDKVPGELMSCAPGQWIEAVVKRDPLTYREIEIESITKISYRLPTDAELKKFWEEMPEADLEDADTTW